MPAPAQVSRERGAKRAKGNKSSSLDRYLGAWIARPRKEGGCTQGPSPSPALPPPAVRCWGLTFHNRGLLQMVGQEVNAGIGAG